MPALEPRKLTLTSGGSPASSICASFELQAR